MGRMNRPSGVGGLSTFEREALLAQLMTPGLPFPGMRAVYRNDIQSTSGAIYTVPAGRRAVVKNIFITKWGGSNGGITYVRTAGYDFVSVQDLAQNDVWGIDCAQVLNAGESIAFVNGSDGLGINGHAQVVEFDPNVLPGQRFHSSSGVKSANTAIVHAGASGTVVTSVTIRNHSGSASTVVLRNTGAGFIESSAIPQGDVHQINQPVALQSGQSLDVSTPADLIFTACGYHRLT